MSDSLQFVYPVVSLACENLTDEELIALNLAVALEIDPRNTLGYDKVSSLFSEESSGTRMHPVTKEAFTLIVRERLL
jgi:hypothetical protein